MGNRDLAIDERRGHLGSSHRSRRSFEDERLLERIRELHAANH